MTIDGYIDRAYTVTNNSDDAKDSKLLSSASGTTTIGIKGVEDLGGGLKVGFSINTDWADLGGLTQDASATAGASSLTGGGTIPSQAGTFGNSQSFIELVSASVGTLRLGSPNNDTLTNAISVASPAFSTGIGSAYSSSWSLHNGMGTGTTGAGGLVTKTALGATGAGQRGIRQANTVKYISPSINGIVFSYTNAQANSNTGTSTVDTVGITEVALRYTAGPVDAMYTSLKYKVGAGTAPLNGGLGANETTTHNLLGVAYSVMPNLKLHGGWGSSKASATTIANSTSTQYGVTYTMGAFDVLAQTAKVDDKNTTGYDRKMTGLGVNYNLSKTAKVYFRMDDLKLNSGGTVTAGDTIKRNAVGFSKSF